MAQMISDNEFDQPLGGAQADEQPPERQWSYNTLRAARPSPGSRYDTRARAEVWNQQFPEGHSLRVNPDEFPETLPEISPEQVERNWDRLRKLTQEFNQKYR